MNESPQISYDDKSTPCWKQAFALPILETGLVLTWSSGFIGARFSLDYAPALLVVFWRCVVVSLVLFPFVAKSLWRTSLSVLLRNAGIGLMAMFLYLAGVTQGIALGVPAGLAALVADLLPIGMALLAALVLRERLARQAWMGLVIGLVGVLLVTHGALAWGDAPLWAYCLPLLGMLSMAIATLWQRHSNLLQPMGLLPNLWLQCFISSFGFAALVSIDGNLAPIATTGFALSVLWTAGISTLGGYGLYWVCLRRASATRVASVLYLSPPVTMVWAWAMFGEPLSWQMASGMAVSTVGIWLVIRAENGSARVTG